VARKGTGGRKGLNSNLIIRGVIGRKGIGLTGDNSYLRMYFLFDYSQQCGIDVSSSYQENFTLYKDTD